MSFIVPKKSAASVQNAPVDKVTIFVDDGTGKLATKDESGTVTDYGGGVASVNGDVGAVLVPTPIGVACSDMTTDLTTGTGKGYFRAPFAMENLTFRATLFDASSSGAVTIDINKNGSTILSTKLTIDATEKTSTTAATPYVATSTTCADDDEYTIDIDGAGADAKGLIVWFIGNKT